MSNLESLLQGILDPLPSSVFATIATLLLLFGALLVTYQQIETSPRTGGLGRALGLAGLCQCAFWGLAFNSRWVLLSCASWLVGEWIYSRIATLFDPQGARWGRLPKVARAAGIAATLSLAWTQPKLTWTEATTTISQVSTGWIFWESILFFGMLVFQSGFLKDRAHRGQSATLLFVELSLHRIPLLLFSWIALCRLSFPIPPETARFLFSLGLLVFLMFQWILLTRNRLIDALSCTATAQTGFFWALVGLSAGNDLSSRYFQVYWTSQLLVTGTAAVLVWMESNQLELNERGLRGMLYRYRSIGIPAAVFFAGLCGQPWVASNLLLGETFSRLLAVGSGVGVLFLLGFILQATKMSHLALVMVLRPTERMNLGFAENPIRPQPITILWLWVLAIAAVAVPLFRL